MPRQRDILREFTTLHEHLVREREQICRRLADLDRALGQTGAPGAAQAAPAPAPTARAAGATSGTQGQKLTMREAIQQATAEKPLSVREIVEAVQRLGFRFTSSNPYNSVGAYLYGPEGKKHFKRSDGGFAAIRGASANGTGRRKRRLSAAGRRAIAEAARRRWAAQRARG